MDQEVERMIKNNIRIDKEFLRWAITEFMTSQKGEIRYISKKQVLKILNQIVSEINVDFLPIIKGKEEK